MFFGNCTTPLSDYFIAEHNGKESIYLYKDGKVTKITKDFDEIWITGVVEGVSNYFIAKENKHYAIYEYKDTHIKKITNDFELITIDGLPKYKSNFFMAEWNGKLHIYHKLFYKEITLLEIIKKI